MRDHRVPLLGDGWRRRADPEKSHDPRVRAVLVGLRGLASDVAPDPAFRAELRAQLVAIAPRVIAESAESEAPAPVRARPASGADAITVDAPRPGARPKHADARPVRGRFGGVAALPLARIATTTICALVALLLLLGVGVVMSHNAVPGDTLYGLKRADEHFELALDSSDTERASDYLRFASTRADEVQTLINRAQSTASGRGLHAGGLSSHTQSMIRSTLSSADSDVLHASRLLATKAVDSASPAPLTAITSWAPHQLSKLSTIAESVAGTPLKTHVASSASLVSKADTRARNLSTTVDCGCLRSAPSDSLGPQPCTACSAPAKKGTKVGGGGTTGQVPVRSGSPLKPLPSHPATVTPGRLAPVTKPADHGTTSHPVTLPTLPITLPTTVTPPLTVNSCGLGISLGGIKLGLNLCKSPQP